MTEPEIKLWTQAGLGLVAVIGALVKLPKILDWGSRRKATRRVKKNMRRVSAILSADEHIRERMVDIVKIHGGQRAMVFTAHNCGQDFRAGIVKFATSTFGVAEDPKDVERDIYNYGAELSSRYQQVLLDDDYRDMLRKIIDKGSYTWKEGLSSLNSKLTKFYRIENITHSKIYLCWLDSSRICYWSVSTSEEGGFTEEQEVKFDLIAGDIRQQCEHAHY